MYLYHLCLHYGLCHFLLVGSTAQTVLLPTAWAASNSSYGHTNMFSIVQPEMRFNVIWPLPTLLPHFLGADEGISVDIIIKRFC